MDYNEIDRQLTDAFEKAIKARNAADEAIKAIQDVRRYLTKLQIKAGE